MYARALMDSRNRLLLGIDSNPFPHPEYHQKSRASESLADPRPPIASTRREASTQQVSTGAGGPGAGVLASLAPKPTTSASGLRAASAWHGAPALLPIGWQPCVGAFWQAAAGPSGQLDAVENFIAHPEVGVLSEEGPLKAGPK